VIVLAEMMSNHGRGASLQADFCLRKGEIMEASEPRVSASSSNKHGCSGSAAGEAQYWCETRKRMAGMSSAGLDHYSP